MRIAFMGTPQLAADILAGIVPHHEVAAVFTRPDAVRGRGKQLVASPVKQRALDLGLDVLTPATLKDESVAQSLESLGVDLVCVVAYGALLPARILQIPRFGCMNAHMSLLPRWRGAAPIQRAILSGDEFCGVSIMKMEEGLDTGPYCLQEKVPIETKNLAQLEGELAVAGSNGFVEAMTLIESGSIQWIEQPEAGVTYAEKIEKSELILDPGDLAWKNVARVKASSEAHPARTVLEGRALTILEASTANDEDALESCKALEPGQASFARKRLFMMAKDGLVELIGVKPDGKKAMDARSFAAGIQGVKGKVLSWERA